MIRHILWLLCYCLYWLAPVAHADVCANQPDASIIGLAKSDSSGEFLYCEYHFNQGDKAVVKYYDSEQQLIASKDVDYSKSTLAPAISQDDYRHGEKVRVQHLSDPDADERYLFMQYQGASQDELSEKPVVNTGDLVVDAGFDNAIRFYWEEIEAKGSATLNFVAPARLRTIKLKVRKKPLSVCLNESQISLYEDAQHICYLVRPLNGLVSLFVKPIKLVYERDSKRLMLFRGNSNITDSQGIGQQAAISYSYF